MIKPAPRKICLLLLMLAGSSILFEARWVSRAQAQSVVAGLITGGQGPGPAPRITLEVAHEPLRGISPVTNLAIIQGATGVEGSVRALNPPFELRLTQSVPPSQRRIRTTVRYRILSPGSTEAPYIDLPPIDGPDPSFAWAFQIPPHRLFRGAVVQYQIESVRLVNGEPDPESRVVYPPLAPVSVGVLNAESQVFDQNGGRLVLHHGNPNVGKTALDIPAGVLKQPVIISLDEMQDPSSFNMGSLPPAVAVYRLDASPSLGSETDIHYKISLSYQDFVFPVGQTGILNGTSHQERDASVAWFNGRDWVRIGGKGDASANTLSLRGNFFGLLAIVPAGALAPQERRAAERIVTPNGDGSNDTAVFLLGDLTQTVKVEILDVTGHRIRTISNSGGTAEWDGRDDSGKLVESGVYIYQFEVDGKRISGLIAVAK